MSLNFYSYNFLKFHITLDFEDSFTDVVILNNKMLDSHEHIKLDSNSFIVHGNRIPFNNTHGTYTIDISDGILNSYNFKPRKLTNKLNIFTCVLQYYDTVDMKTLTETYTIAKYKLQDEKVKFYILEKDKAYTCYKDFPLLKIAIDEGDFMKIINSKNNRIKCVHVEIQRTHSILCGGKEHDRYSFCESIIYR